jgi:predicted DNA binding CopG/RHH family protein
MKKKLSKAELNKAEAAFAGKIYAERNAVNKEAMSVMKAAGSRPVTFRMSNSVIELARQQAEAKGLKYQTYIKMLLHQAVTGEAGAKRA